MRFGLEGKRARPVALVAGSDLSEMMEFSRQ